MKKPVSLSVVTLTKNRAQLLKKCLSSLRGQLNAGDEIIIIDNCSTDNTQSIIHTFQHDFTMRVYTSMLSGYPNLYNFAIAKSTKSIVVFFDDDCVASEGFIRRIRDRYKKKSDYVLQGKTLSLPRNNIFAEISEDHLSHWMNSNMLDDNTLTIIDNRCVAIPKSILKKVGGFSTAMKFGSEDVELGKRLFYAGVSIKYDPLLIAYHNERITLKSFLSQHLRIAKSHAILDGIPSKEKKISIINAYTWKNHMLSFLSREVEYWHNKRYKDLLYLSVVYILLGAVRILGYLRLFG